MVRGIGGGMHRGLVMAALLGAGLVETSRGPLVVEDRDLEPVDRDPAPPPLKPKRLATPPQPTAGDRQAMTVAAEKRARKNARRLVATETA